MAIARCKDHPPQGRTQEYVSMAEPVGYPETALICGIASCDNAALVFLSKEDELAYNGGSKVFKLPTAAAKVKSPNEKELSDISEM